MRIQTGQGTIPLATLLAIWSISAITALPGLAVSPIMGKLDTIFPDVSQLEIQMLSSIPSLLIIPFVLLSGRLAEKKNKTMILVIGLVIFLASGVLYFFAESMWALILISCVLGVGAGMIVPLSTGLVADFFVGSYRTKQMGISSAITNLSLVLATEVTGWLAEINWHLPFVVYFLPSLALALSYFLRGDVLKKNNVVSIGTDKDKPSTDDANLIPAGKQLNVPYLIGLMVLYFVVCYAAIIVALNLPFIMQAYKYSSSMVGTVISVFFLAIMLPGLILNKLLSLFKKMTIFYGLLSIALGLLIVSVTANIALIFVGVIFTGLGYGLVQPIIYDKTANIATSKAIVLALAFVMSVNYLSILTTPFIVDGLASFLQDKSEVFPFRINFIIMVLFTLLAYTQRNNYVFSTAKK